MRKTRNSYNWDYPRLYSFPGSGTEEDPFLINTPAQLIYFPNSFEYYSYSKFNFRLGRCIDMNEVAPGAYVPATRCCTSYTYTYYGSLYHSENTPSYSTCYPFKGNLTGRADDCHDESCPFHHENLGTNSKGETLTESHIIYNLQILEPVYKFDKNPSTGEYYTYSSSYIQTARQINNYFMGLIACATAYTEISDLQFIGGKVDPGSHDVLYKNDTLNRVEYSNTNYDLRYLYPCLYQGILMGRAGYSDGMQYYGGFNSGDRGQPAVFNVHSSAEIKVGTGDSTSMSMGGIIGGGYCRELRNCSNSSDFYGGYRTISRKSTIHNEQFCYGGIIGSGGASASSDLVNYGDIYAVCLIGDGTRPQDVEATSSYCGIGGSSLGYEDYGDCYNEGNIYDGPIELDENGEPVFEEATEEGVAPKPKRADVPEGKVILCNDTENWNKHKIQLSGISSNTKYAYNKGNLYAVFGYYVDLYGIGGYTEYAYNAGDLYVYTGSRQACGVCYSSATRCLNEGNVSYYGGAEWCHYSTVVAGVSSSSTKECYNNGTVYFAPAGTTTIQVSDTSLSVSAYGVGGGVGKDYYKDDFH